MKSLSSIFVLLSLSFTTIYGQAAKQLTDKLNIEFKKNVELLGFAYFLGFEGQNIETKMMEINGKLSPKKDWHNYGYAFYKEYKSCLTNEDLNKAFMVADHLWLDVITSFLLQVDDFPNAHITEDIPLTSYLSFSTTKDPIEARKNAEIFLEGLNNFYKAVDFDAYLAKNQKHYDLAVQEIESTLGDPKLIEHVEAFFQKSFQSYTLVPSLTVPKGMGFGIKMNDQQIYSVFGSLGWQEIDDPNHLNMGFTNAQRLQELSIHEFGHSFCNPAVDLLPSGLIEQTDALYKPVAMSMANQGYMSWKASVYEHFVRASELIISKQYDTQEAYETLKQEYLEERKFIYIPTILEVLESYKEKGLTFEAAVEQSMIRLQEKMPVDSGE
ncbi:MAG: DUF4932 domain-containing protein [Bacteroidota bacterium]